MMTPLSLDAFVEKYKPQQNHLDSNASWDGCMFETYGPELEYVQQIQQQAPGRVWTIVDCDGELFVSSGFHLVNRFGYLITEIACPEGEVIEAVDPD